MNGPVKATPCKFDDGSTYYKGDRLHGRPGSMIPVDVGGVGGFIIACPNCGEFGSPRDGQTWQVTEGSRDDVSTLTLTPSIQKHCCGWHGYLDKGLFVLERPGG